MSVLPEGASGVLMCHIYGLRDPASDQIGYVGQTINPGARQAQHFKERVLPAKHVRDQWLQQLRAAGRDPEFVILEVVPSQEANAAERRWISRLEAEGHPLTNIEHSSVHHRQPLQPSMPLSVEPQGPKELITAAEAAALKGVTRQAVYAAIREGRLPSRQFGDGKTHLIRRGDVERWHVYRHRPKKDQTP